MPNFSELVDAYKKIPTSLFFAIGFILGLILFSPDSWIEKFSLSDFLVKYRVCLGLHFYVFWLSWLVVRSHLSVIA